MAEQDSQRYAQEMEGYVPPAPTGKVVKRKRKKDPDAPKRALSAFFWYCSDRRPIVKKEHPDWTVGQVKLF